MTDEELVKALRDAVNGEHDMTPHGADCLQAADRIEALTEQLEAARADAKEAEAYAEELEGGKALRRISPSDLHAVFARRDEWAYVSPMDEGNCVTLDGDFNFSQIAEDINAALAEIEGEKG
jgi:hypothetical protein